ncbi:hypothetical protein C8R47DRAFT_1281992, partial [Mycena vitilis]
SKVYFLTVTQSFTHLHRHFTSSCNGPGPEDRQPRQAPSPLEKAGSAKFSLTNIRGITYTKSLENFLWPRVTASDLDAAFPRFKPGELFRKGYKNEPALYFPRTAPPGSDETVTLVNLPEEMAHEIFSHIADFCDLLCLSMSCQALWEIGREHLYRHIAAVVADHSWIGDRIICIGEDIQRKDIPDTMFTPAEEAEFFRYATLEDYHGYQIREDSTPSEIAELLRNIERSLFYYPFRHNTDQETMFDQSLLVARYIRSHRAWQFQSDLEVVMYHFYNHDIAPQPPAHNHLRSCASCAICHVTNMFGIRRSRN